MLQKLTHFLAIVLFTSMLSSAVPANIYLFKVNNKNTRKRCEICSTLTIKTPERRLEGTFYEKQKTGKARK